MTGSETVDRRGARMPRVSPAALAVAGLVVVSTIVRFAAAHWFTTPWIAPDEMVYGLIGESLWSSGTLEVRGLPSPYYSILTPALVGAPLALLDLADGIRWAQLLQALAASLVAVPTYRWARRLASTGWAIAAAAITLAAPALHYAGFLMTEPLTLTVVTAALLALARAVEEPTTWRYGIFAAWATAAAAVRLQALVLLPAFLIAVALDAVAARDRSRLRPLAWLAGVAALVALAVGALVVVRGGELSAESVLGAYTPIGESSGVDSDWMVAILWHAFDVAILGLAIPVLAIAALAFCVFARRDHDPALRAFVAVTLAYVTLLVVQVGLFAAEYVGHVAERYLITALPLLAIGLCAWIARGAPRALAVVLPVWALLVAAAALIPLEQIAERATLVSTLTPSALEALSDGQARAALVAGTILAGAIVVAVPRRWAWTAAAVVGVTLAVASYDSGRRIVDASAHEDRAAMGLGAADVARRRRPRGRHAPRDRRSSLDIDGADDVLEPRDQRGAPDPAGRAPVPADHRGGRDRGRRGGSDGDGGRASPTRRDCAVDARACRREGRGAPGGGQRDVRLDGVAPRRPGPRHPSRGRAPPERRLRRVRHGSPSMPAGPAPSTSP